MKKGLVLLTHYFEDTEGIGTIDILKRAGLELDIVSVTSELEIVTQCENRLLLKKTLHDCNLDDYDFLFIPGGKAVMMSLSKMDYVYNVITSFASNGRLVATICAAPMLVGKLGLFENRKFTCFPGCEAGIRGKYTKESIQVSDNFITGKSMAYSIEFGLEIVKYLLGKETYNKVKESVYATF